MLQFLAFGAFVLSVCAQAHCDGSLLDHHMSMLHTSTLSTGIWRYSRHPNCEYNRTLIISSQEYLTGRFCLIWVDFFQFLQWCCLAIFSNLVSKSCSSPAFAAPLIVLYSLLFVTGISAVEKLSTRPGYAAYCDSTSVFVPWLPKQNSKKNAWIATINILACLNAMIQPKLFISSLDLVGTFWNNAEKNEWFWGSSWFRHFSFCHAVGDWSTQERARLEGWCNMRTQSNSPSSLALLTRTKRSCSLIWQEKRSKWQPRNHQAPLTSQTLQLLHQCELLSLKLERLMEVSPWLKNSLLYANQSSTVRFFHILVWKYCWIQL